MTINGVFKSNLRVTSKSTALEFYKGVKSAFFIQTQGITMLRIEPGQHISFVPNESFRNGTVAFIPAIYDEDGTLAYRNRKYINAYLRSIC